MSIPIGISNRHVHLNKQDCDILFGNNYQLNLKRKLTQTGEFACEETVSLKTEGAIIEHVRVIGPLREYTQVELLASDSNILKINPPKRNSGDLSNSESIIIIGPKGEIYKENSCIIANRHIHMNEKDASNYQVNHNDIVSIKKDSTIINDVNIKINNSYVLECHLDKDDELKYGIHTGDLIEIVGKYE